MLVKYQEFTLSPTPHFSRVLLRQKVKTLWKKTWKTTLQRQHRPPYPQCLSPWNPSCRRLQRPHRPQPWLQPPLPLPPSSPSTSPSSTKPLSASLPSSHWLLCSQCPSLRPQHPALPPPPVSHWSPPKLKWSPCPAYTQRLLPTLQCRTPQSSKLSIMSSREGLPNMLPIWLPPPPPALCS